MRAILQSKLKDVQIKYSGKEINLFQETFLQY